MNTNRINPAKVNVAELDELDELVAIRKPSRQEKSYTTRQDNSKTEAIHKGRHQRVVEITEK